MSTAALSLIDYATKPTTDGMSQVRAAVRASLGMSSGSPEIVFNVLLRGTIDPMLRWILTNLRLWHAYSRQGESEMLEAVRKIVRGSRLSTLLRELTKLGVDLTPTQITIAGSLFYLRMDWKELRPRILKGLKSSSWNILATRRPGTYGGLEGRSINVNLHKKFLASLPPYVSKVLLRIWSGCALTRKHKHKIGMCESPICACGMEDEDVPHIVARCSLLPPPEWDLLQWNLLPPANSCALLFLEGMDPHLVPTWKRVCMRVVRSLT